MRLPVHVITKLHVPILWDRILVNVVLVTKGMELIAQVINFLTGLSEIRYAINRIEYS